MISNFDEFIKLQLDWVKETSKLRITCSIQQQINKILLENNNQENDEVLRLKKLIEDLN